MAEANSAIEAVSLSAGYGAKMAIEDVSLALLPHEIVAIIGHNGSGKSTLLKAIFGTLRAFRGMVRVQGCAVLPSPLSMLRKGVVLVPQGGRVFGRLTVRENLELAGHPLRKQFVVANRTQDTLDLFPELGVRLGALARTLSGGQQQMLSVACGLVTSPRVLLLDEPSAGLPPERASSLFLGLRNLAIQKGVGILIVEQRVNEVLALSDRACVLRAGRTSFLGSSAELKDPQVLRRVFL